MDNASQSPLGKPSSYVDHYDASLLFSIARAEQRRDLGLVGALPFHGADIWNAYELSWLDARGKPQVAIGEFRVPAESPNIVESKSLKLYLNSFSQTRFDSTDEAGDRISDDLSDAAGAAVAVTLFERSQFASLPFGELAGESLDALPIAIDEYGPPSPRLLATQGDVAPVHEVLVSNLLKSNCPVTAQPDWASVQIAYSGAPIDREALLRYLVSFRRHDDFHEQCVERIFTDILRECAPSALRVYARYTRRGGLDINPWRSSAASEPPQNLRNARQ
ncbi:MAG: NADPH-dependent 7-cyano-7-deazaguanine reductase QueF [Dokdonella sp.]